MRSTPLAALLSSSAAVLLLWACGGSSKPPEEPHGEVLPLTQSSASAAAPVTPPPTASATAAPPPVASAAPEPEKEKKRPVGGAPMAVTEDDTSVTATYGARGGKIRIGGVAELLIPPDTVDVATNFTLAKNTGKDQLKIPAYKGQMGDVYRIGYARPDSSAPSVAASGAPFLLKLPLPKGKETANLVIATPAGDNHGKYTVIAPKSVEDGPNGKVAVFELPNIVAQAMVHLTSSPPTGK